ncbi:Bardet-Biedl syndrome 2 protein homolog [Paramacrobiotus metropolitanus]|uniref:Bardet-Biedl syndrome 2 protein homolog n=1 Tax=Paramacrobiotus metropolitanus TaxID=2943436 RepID=UPI002445C616|nr:Bardet-Biedl syndrome 2 protein homolog [Paramacrobiotus metropolitanus]
MIDSSHNSKATLYCSVFVRCFCELNGCRKLEKMLRALYDLQLQHMLRPGRVVVGEFAPGEMYLAAANMANKVVISRLPSASAYASRIVPAREHLQILNINQTITSLAVGRFTTDAVVDYLFIGTSTEMVVYDVPQNREVFRKSTTGGATSITVGRTGRIKKTLAIVGGQNALQGFDEDGNEPLWTLTGDNVAVLILFDINKDGQIEIIAGCDDHQIRIFRETEQIFSMMETDTITSLAPLKDQCFVYGLANGTVGVYEQYERKWRIKSKSKPLSLLGFDMNGDGEPEIFCGWSNGKFEVRDRLNGSLLFKYQMDDPVAQIMEVGDLKHRGESYILVTSTEGNVKAFAIEDGSTKEYTVTFLQDAPQSESQDPVISGENRESSEKKPENVVENSVATKERSLFVDAGYQWSTMPDDAEVVIEVEPVLGSTDVSGDSDRKPHKNEVFSSQMQNFMRRDELLEAGGAFPNLFENPCLKFTVRTNIADYKIAGVVIFAEGVFSGESYYHRLPEKYMSSRAEFPIVIPKNTPIDMFVTVMAGQENRRYYFCHGELIRIKRFAMYYNILDDALESPEGYVTFQVHERINRFLLWASENFFLRSDVKAAGDPSGVVLKFRCLRDGAPLQVNMGGDGEVTIMTNCIDTAGDIVESIAEGMTIKLLSSRAHFPKAFNSLKDVFVQIDEYQKNRQRQAADIADRGSAIRSLLMKAEETKVLELWPEVRKYYLELRNQNKNVLSDFRIQIDAQAKFTSGLKLISQTIDKAARLRVGAAKTDLFTRCRSAVQNRDVQLLVKLMEFGAS